MSSERFQWLEYGDDPPPRQTDRATSEGVAPQKDLAYHLKEARSLYLDGEYEPALRHFSAMLKFEAGSEESWAGQIRCLVRLKSLKEAMVWSEKGLQQLPSSPLMLSAAALALSRDGQLEQALRSSDAALSVLSASSRTEPAVWLERASCLLAGGQQESAVTCIDSVCELVGNDGDWLQAIGLEYLEAGDATHALKWLNLALDRQPDRAYLWLLASRAARGANLLGRAEFCAKQALDLRANYWEALQEIKQLPRSRPCWIASTLYEDPDHAAVVALRRWRDLTWLTHPIGRRAARLYDVTAPSLCRVLLRVPSLRRPLRWLLSRVVIYADTRTTKNCRR